MSQFRLQENEVLIGSGMMAYKHRESITREPTRGTIYVTNQRVCYHESLSGHIYMDLRLSDVLGYEVKRALFITFVHIYDRNNKCYRFSGFSAKNLQGWLHQVEVQRLS